MDNIAPFELPGLIRLALLANQDDKANAAIARWLKLAPDNFVRADRLVQSMRFETWSGPFTAARLHAAEADAAQLTAMANAEPKGSLTAEECVWGQELLTQIYRELGKDSLAYASMNRSIALALNRLTPSQSHEVLPFSLYLGVAMSGAAADMEGYRFSAQSAPKFAAVLDKYFQAWFRDHGLQNSDMYREVNSDIQELRMHPSVKQLYRIFEYHRYHPVTMDAWFNRPDSTVSYPRAGVPSVTIGVVTDCGDYCYPFYAMYKRLYTEFASKGVDFLMLAHLEGHIHLSGPITTEQEIDSIKTKFLSRLKLPGVLGIKSSEYYVDNHGAQEDGYDALGNTNNFPYRLPEMTVVFKDGYSNGNGEINGVNMTGGGEEMFRHFLANQVVDQAKQGTSR